MPGDAKEVPRPIFHPVSEGGGRGLLLPRRAGFLGGGRRGGRRIFAGSSFGERGHKGTVAWGGLERMADRGRLGKTGGGER